MASSYTSGYHLCQWQPQDAFLRAEFNADNQALDEALSGLEGRLALVERQLPAMQYHLYNLLLRQHYDGKETGYKKALWFDGLLDGSRISAVTPGAVYDKEARRVRVVTQGAQNVKARFMIEDGGQTTPGSDGSQCAWIGSMGDYYKERVITPSGFGELKSVTLRLARYQMAEGHPESNVTVRVQLLDGEQVLATSNTVTVTDWLFHNTTFTFPKAAVVEPRSYTLRVENVNHAYYLRAALEYDGEEESGGSQIGADLVYTPRPYTTGAFTSVKTDLGENYSRALGWVRHMGGSVALSIQAGSGAFVPAKVLSTRQTVSLEGENCKETAFCLEQAAESPNNQVTVQLSLTADGGGCAVCDYGITFY